jgi:hypothetical protein
VILEDDEPDVTVAEDEAETASTSSDPGAVNASQDTVARSTLQARDAASDQKIPAPTGQPTGSPCNHS